MSIKAEVLRLLKTHDKITNWQLEGLAKATGHCYATILRETRKLHKTKDDYYCWPKMVNGKATNTWYYQLKSKRCVYEGEQSLMWGRSR